MLLGLEPEQEQLRDAARSYLGPRANAGDSSALDPDGANRLALDLDVVGLAVPEALGGSGAGLVEVAVVLGELGRVLSPVPYLSTVLALEALMAARSAGSDVDDLVRRLVVGDLRATIVGPVLAGASSVEATEAVLSGTAGHVLDGESADLLVVFAAEPTGGLGLYLADARGQAGIVRAARAGLDGARSLARVEFQDLPVRPLAGPAAVPGLLERLVAVGAVGLAAEQVGAAERALEVAVEHATVRTQFGRPIGSFQAVKHRCADSRVMLEAARWAALHAAWAVQERQPDYATLAGMAKSSTSDAFVQVAASTIQVLGGIGYTWEHSAHRYYRRAVSSRELFGSPARHRERVAAGLLSEEAAAWAT